MHGAASGYKIIKNSAVLNFARAAAADIIQSIMSILSILSNAVGMLSLMTAAVDIFQSIMSTLSILSNAVGMLSLMKAAADFIQSIMSILSILSNAVGRVGVSGGPKQTAAQFHKPCSKRLVAILVRNLNRLSRPWINSRTE